MRLRIQNLILPTETKHKACRKLFYRQAAGVVDEEKKSLWLGFAQTVDFATYMNACSWRKWQKYTGARRLKLHLVLGRGKAKISLLGYHQAGLDTVRQEFGTEIVELEQGGEWEYEFPENDEQMVGFELAALSPELEIKAGYFTVEVDEKKLQPVKLAIATTTCRKEDFIRKNVGLIRQELLEQDTEAAQNLFLHVVDNGRTLTEKEIKGRHVYLHPNRNTGGSGGFSRGMIEAMQQKPVATHVLLMDDDVLVLPESIYRTYMLLRALKPEYRECFVEGAMLHYEEPHLQHEDIGMVKYNERGVKPLKGILDQTLLANNLQTETIEPPETGGYGAWWFCCIPVSHIKECGLSLPLFLRYDDVEFGLRKPVQIITLIGICVWHQLFFTKHSNMTKYFDARNALVVTAAGGLYDWNVVRNHYEGEVRTLLMSFRYDAAEAVVSALEDFLKGSEILKRGNEEELLASKGKLNESLRPLSEFGEGAELIQPNQLWENPPMAPKTRVFLKLTWNGQVGHLPYRPRAGRGVTIYDLDFQPEKVAYYDEVLAVDPYTMQGVLYQKDRQRFAELYERYQKAMTEWKQRQDELANEYRAARDELVSVEFWKKYLGLE